MTYNEILEYQENLPNGGGFEFEQYRLIDNSVNFSFHVYDLKNNINYNVWFCKYREMATITLFDDSKNEFHKYTEILRTENLNEIKKEITKIWTNTN